MATIYVDEAGYTGSNLLDPAQPVFVLSTHDFDEPDSLRLKAEYFGAVKGPSLKFTKLSRNGRGQGMILRFLADMLKLCPTRFGTVLIHKPFSVICKLVDHVVENSMHNHGFDLYDRGGNLGMCNGIYLVTQSVAGEPYLRRLRSVKNRL
jgi:hypothetical protein